jgi:primary-amine oxidase
MAMTGRTGGATATTPLLARHARHFPPALALLLLFAGCGARAAEAHPLDPLSAAEIETAVGTLRAAGDADSTTRYALIDLYVPAKQEVLAWRSGQDLPRKAFVIARRDRVVNEGVVDLGQRRVERWRAVPHVESALVAGEIKTARDVTMADAGWQAAMRRRGFDRFDLVFCQPLAPGYDAVARETGRRIVRVVCFAGPANAADVWARPIAGLTAVVDLDVRKVIRLIDEGAVPVVTEVPRLGRSPPSAAMPGEPRKKPEFVVAGNEVHWHHWWFHYRLSGRVGLIVSLVRYDDHDEGRLILYRGSLAEMFVPYMDPDRDWVFRTYMDAGELGLGLLSSPLAPGIDCPEDATFFDAVLSDDRGEPVLGKSVICLFERDTGAPLWRHYESANGRYRGRPATELVLRTIPSIGNYDYVIDWVMNDAGTIRIDVGATGIDQVKGVRAATMHDASAAADTAYGALLAPHLVGTNHDHFLSFRLDLDIDGTGNTLVRDRFVRQTVRGRGGRKSLWRVIEAPVTTEGPLRGWRADRENLRIVNPNVSNRLGQHPGYAVCPGRSATSLFAPDDVAQRRAGFSAASFWVTAYDPAELYAAGMFPNQSGGGGGLPTYASRRRRVENADIVVWYTMGFHHLPSPEDWPVMSTKWHSLALVPDGFFDRNPALDVK